MVGGGDVTRTRETRNQSKSRHVVAPFSLLSVRYFYYRRLDPLAKEERRKEKGAEY